MFMLRALQNAPSVNSSAYFNGSNAWDDRSRSELPPLMLQISDSKYPVKFYFSQKNHQYRRIADKFHSILVSTGFLHLTNKMF